MLRGKWDGTGAWGDSSTNFTIACGGADSAPGKHGVLAKCALWGYRPWTSSQDTTGAWVDLRHFHQACTRAARADYDGNGVSHTHDGTWIDV